MKYSILGFSQERVLRLQKEQDGKVKKLDVTDLLILRDVADFMNRSKIIKYTIDDKVYFSIQYSAIIEDLPLIDIKKQALSDRLDKMVFLGVLEKVVVKNQCGTFVAFRMGKEYEGLLYSCTSSEILPTSSQIQVQSYPTTSHNTNKTNNHRHNKEIREDKSSLTKRSEVVSGWRNDFDAYLKLVEEAKIKLLSDTTIKAKKEKYYPDIDYELSIEKMIEDFWGTEEGWKHKVKTSKKTKEIDMVKTLAKAFDLSGNRVYKRAHKQGNSMGASTTKTIKGISNLPDGANEDGTFNKNNFRYYHSLRDNIDYSIPPSAPPMPSFECEYNPLTKEWYYPKDNNDAYGELW